MGKRGPRKEPIELARERGVYRADRHGEVVVIGDRVAAEDIVMPARFLEMHDELPESAPSPIDAWADVTVPIGASDLVQATDLPALEMTALALWTYRFAEWELRKYLQAEGSITYRVGENGAMAPHPALAIRDRAAKEYQSWAARFGFTPSDRVTLGLGIVQGQTMTDALERKLGASPRKPK